MNGIARRRPSARLFGAALAVASATACAGADGADTTDAATSAANPAPSAAAAAVGNPFRIGRPLAIPHAGGDGLFPANTLYAYEHSLAMGGDVVDIDVQLAADGVLMAIHDATVDGTTNGVGLVRDLTSGEIGLLDAGWTFEQSGAFPFRGLGIRVPTVEAVLLAFPDSLATLDLKDQRIAVVEPVCELLTRLDRGKRIYVGVDTDEQVLEFRRLCPAVYTSGTSADRAASRAARETNDPTFVSTQLVSQPGFRNDDGTIRITDATLAFAHRFNTAVLTYVIDQPSDMEFLIELGVDGIYTRRPDLLVPIIEARFGTED